MTSVLRGGRERSCSDAPKLGIFEGCSGWGKKVGAGEGRGCCKCRSFSNGIRPARGEFACAELAG